MVKIVETHEEQLQLWVSGQSVHVKSNIEDYECCPDFSCCGGDLAPLKTREAFKAAVDRNDSKTIAEMCMNFLQMRLNKHFEEGNKKKDVYVAGHEAEGEA